MRLQKYMANAGIGSRRKCEEFIKNSLVTVNGKTITEMGFIIDPQNDAVKYNNRIIKHSNYFFYIMLNKPVGVITTMNDENDRLSIIDIVKIKNRFFPIGRLDKNTRGLLLLTNDGEYAQKILHPSKKIEKTYKIRIKEKINRTQIDKLRQSLIINQKKTKPAVITNIKQRDNCSQFKITITEGKNRQIRRMCRFAGVELLELKRETIGKLKLNMPEGKWRYLTKHEADMVFE